MLIPVSYADCRQRDFAHDTDLKQKLQIQQQHAPEGPGRSESPGRARRREISLLTFCA